MRRGFSAGKAGLDVLTVRVFLEVQCAIKVVIPASGLADFLGD